VRLGVAVVDQLDLQVHRRAPHHVGAAHAAPRLVDHARVEFGGVHVVVFDAHARMQGLEVVQHRLDHLEVRRRIDDHDAFLARLLETVGHLFGTRHGRRRGQRHARQCGPQPAAHAPASHLAVLPVCGGLPAARLRSPGHCGVGRLGRVPALPR